MKLDGYRIQAILNDDEVQLFTRSGLDWSDKFSQIKSELELISNRGIIFDGEIVVLDERGRSRFHLLGQSLKNELKAQLYYFVFDLLFLEGEDIRSLPLWERKQKLKDILPPELKFIQYVDHVIEHGEEFFEVACEEELEGIISKEVNSTYSSGRSTKWLKKKCQNREEFIIGGWTEHSSVAGKIGALLLGQYQNDKFIYVGKVGTGFNQKELKNLKLILGPLEQKKSGFHSFDLSINGIHWVSPEVIVEIKFQNWTMDKVLRGAVYQGIREDKTHEEMKMQSIEHLSSPEKIIYQEEGITKEVVANFYREISSHILRWSKHRPLSLVRCPQGTSQKCFFQKHLDLKKVGGIHYFAVEEKDGIEEYFSLENSSGLLELVQLNGYEIHSWNCQDDELDHPNQIVFDLDPDEGIFWDDLVWAAVELRELLLDLELTSFIKLTGGKGVHLHVPIIPKYSWDEVKSFALTVGRELVQRHPQKFTTNMSLKVRKGKIFIDYLRNAHGSTAVIPYSLRARVRATVAMPIEWDELTEVEGGDHFGLREALKKIKKRQRDPWQNYHRKKQKILILEDL